MPYVGLTTTLKLDTDQKKAMRNIIGDTISLIPGKSLAVTVITVSDDAYISKGADDAPSVFVDVRIKGNATFESKNDFVAAVTRRINEEFSIEPPNIYINILENEFFGSNGSFH